MKFFLFFLFFTQAHYAQPVPLSVSPVDNIDHIDEAPLYKNQPIETLRTFIAQNYNYPYDALQAGIEGMIIVEFVIETNGEIGSIEVVKKLCESCDNEAIRILKKLKGITPAKSKNIPVRSKMRLPIHLITQ